MATPDDRFLHAIVAMVEHSSLDASGEMREGDSVRIAPWGDGVPEQNHPRRLHYPVQFAEGRAMQRSSLDDG